jgi:hypothetical protein
MQSDIPELKFLKSGSNKRVENSGLAYLLADGRFQTVDITTKRRIVELTGVSGAFGPQTFDAVMTRQPQAPITIANVDEVFPRLRLVEMKTTRKPIRNAQLNGFFFGATEREYEMATALGDRYLFAFVVLNSNNEYGRPFAVLLPLSEVERRTRSKRIQFQVNFRTDITNEAQSEAGVLLDHLLQAERDSANPAALDSHPAPKSDQ